MNRHYIAGFLVVSMLGVSASAQTVYRPPQPPAQAAGQNVNQRIAAGQDALGQMSVPPISEDVLKQAADQRAGNYGTLSRPAMASGQIQEAWNKSGKNQGVHERLECGTCVYKVRTREFMVTAIQLPDGVEIAQADLGDESAFDMDQRAPNTLVVMPKASGVDSSMQVYSADGRVFTFYLRAEGVNSKQVPDLYYKIKGFRTYRPSFKTFFSSQTAAGDASLAQPQDLDIPEPPLEDEAAAQDFIKEVKYDPSKLRGWNSYKLWGSDELRPETVFRDDYFTYIQFGDRWSEIDLPTAYIVYDDYDELVNTRVQGTTYIVESTNKLITLKSGKKYLCIQYRGE